MVNSRTQLPVNCSFFFVFSSKNLYSLALKKIMWLQEIKQLEKRGDENKEKVN